MVEDFMKKATILFVTFLFTIMMPFAIYSQSVADVSGTWIGTTDFPNTPGKDSIVLTLKKQGDSFSGTIKVGQAKDVPCEKLAFSDEDSFSFEFVLDNGDSKVRIVAKLDYASDKLLGNKLMGAWTIESGEYGILELELKK
jgi:hypothetical protein